MELLGPLSGPAAPAGHGPSTFEKWNEGLAVVDIGRRQSGGRGQAAAFSQDVTLGAELAAVGWVGTRVAAAQGGRDAACVHRSSRTVDLPGPQQQLAA